MSRIFLSILAIMIFAVSAPAVGDSNKPATLKPLQTAQLLPMPVAKKLVLPAAQLMRVDEGVFELELGKTIDLTDRKILLAISLHGHRKECCLITLNGERASWRQVGSRVDLKQERSTSKFVEDKEICYLDVVDIALPKGAPGIATFRLHCI